MVELGALESIWQNTKIIDNKHNINIANRKNNR
jgi:hypothetical protein